MKYISTRGQTSPMAFQDAVLTGMAPDGGLLVPEQIPDVSAQLNAWSSLSYPELALEVFKLYTDIPENDLKRLVDASYSTFRHPDVAPVVPAGDLFILELFHGPTLAFKDIAMQFLSNCFDYILEERDLKLNILGSTSGDTGSAAIHGVRGKKRINIFMMHPKGKTSPLQEKQMTSVLDANVHNIAIEGTFDDCQGIMKSIFRDVAFKEKHALGAVNSVNWCRVMAQIVYYFYAGFRVMESTGSNKVSFSVPTGNFGNILAGYYAKRMGLPVERLILATNENDILSRFINTGTYSSGDVAHTISPSMDIQVASNFERYLYAVLDEDSSRVCEAMQSFEQAGRLSLDSESQAKVATTFAAASGDTAHTMEAIGRYAKNHNYILDPHTAVGVYAAEQLKPSGCPCVCLATAHPAKFPDAIQEAAGNSPTHPVLDALGDSETRCDELSSDEQLVRHYLDQRI